MKFKPQDGRLQKVAHIDPSSITVSGLSSGGFMSTQLHVAFSDLFQGSAAIAGGPFDCSLQNTDVKTVKEQCMLGLASEKGYAYFYAQAVSLFSNGQIANLNNLKSKPVYIFNSADDQVIAPVLGFINNEFFTQLESKVTAEALLYPDSPGYLVAHGMANNNPYFGLFLSEEIGSVDPYTPCAPSGGQSTPWYLKLISRGADPWLYYCQYPDAITPLPVTPASTPEKILKTLYGSIKPMGTPKDSGFFTLEQLPYAQMVDPTIKTVQDLNARGLNQNAFAYVPEFCQNINNTCKLHVALHGCQQFTGWTIVPKVGSYFYKKGMLSFPFGNTFYYQSDFAAFAETNQMIVLFPQAWNIGTDASSVNPYGCWEFLAVHSGRCPQFSHPFRGSNGHNCQYGQSNHHSEVSPLTSTSDGPWSRCVQRSMRCADHILRRYCPPTSKRAWVIWPSEQQRTASISTSNTLPFSITACLRRASCTGACLAWRAWKSRSRLSWLCFSSSVLRANSRASGTGSPLGLRKVLTPMMGYSPVCLSIS
jgi:hypothetical protein